VAQAAFALLFREPPDKPEVLRFLQATVRHFCNTFELDGMGEFILVTGGELDAVLSIWIAAEVRDFAEAKRGVDFVALQFDPRNLGCVELNV
jgi:hypothetical protein